MYYGHVLIGRMAPQEVRFAVGRPGRYQLAGGVVQEENHFDSGMGPGRGGLPGSGEGAGGEFSQVGGVAFAVSCEVLILKVGGGALCTGGEV